MDSTQSQAIRYNFMTKATYFLHLQNVQSVQHINNHTLTNSGLKTDMFNVLIYAPNYPLDNALTYFAKTKLPFACWCFDETLTCDELTLTEQETLMVAETDKLRPMLIGIDNFTIKQVKTGSDILAFGQVLAGLAETKEEYEAIMAYYTILGQRKDFCKSNLPLYLGLLNHQPVVTGSICYDGQNAGIYDLAVDKQFRRQGIGTLMLNYLISQIKQTAYRQIVLQASADGLSLYQRHGFASVGVVNIYSPKAL